MEKPDLTDLDDISRDNVLIKKMISEALPFTREQYIVMLSLIHI